uniref:Uncharacterized protein n=1 Tax=Tanacetum cinerariifolium TaxID=118510 RepID=A0A6L2NLM5_TANCI|nr:hypothetical protein [Tanacetum cinerariifolium]
MSNDPVLIECECDLALYNALCNSVQQDKRIARKDSCKESNLKKQPHDDQDPPKNLKGRRIKTSKCLLVNLLQKKCTFKESNYRQLNLNDIEDMYVLKAQGKLHHLGGQAEYDLANSPLIFIRSEVIKKRVEDVHLGFESYQKKLNLTKLEFDISRIREYPAYTTCPDPYGVIYTDIHGGNRFIEINEVLKFGDATIKCIYEELEVMLKENTVG